MHIIDVNIAHKGEQYSTCDVNDSQICNVVPEGEDLVKK